MIKNEILDGIALGIIVFLTLVMLYIGIIFLITAWEFILLVITISLFLGTIVWALYRLGVDI